METTKFTADQKIMHTIQLVTGEFTPSEASDAIMSLIDEKLNFYKIQRLQKYYQDNDDNSDEIDNRIQQLEKEKQIAKDFINNARNLKSNLNINGVLEITIVGN